MNEGEKAGSQLVVARGYSAKLLELEKKLLHQMPLLVLPPIDIPRVVVIRLRWNTKVCIVVGNVLTKSPLPICPVCQHRRSFQLDSAEQFLGHRDVARVPRRQQHLDRIAQSIYYRVYLGAPATSTHSDAFIRLRLVLTRF